MAAKHPRDPAQFQSGDLLWTKVPGVPVIRSSGASGNDADVDEHTSEEGFERGRKALLAELEPLASKTPEQWALLERLRPMTYGEFSAVYFEGAVPDKPQPRSSTSALVGHVAIIEIAQDGTIHVVEAVPKEVHRVTYESWKARNACRHVWHGRVSDASDVERARIPEIAKEYLGRTYELYGQRAFNFRNEDSFYCSKLVWVSVLRALGVHLDGNPDVWRPFWLSPKDLLYAQRVERLYDPVGYSSLR